MKRFRIHSITNLTLVLTIFSSLLISLANAAERILYESFEVVDTSGYPIDWQRAGHPSYISAPVENTTWSTPYGTRGMSTYGSGVATKIVGYLPEASGDYTLNFNISSSGVKGEYRAELWAIDWVNSPILVGFAVGDTDGSKNMSFTGQITWRYNYDPINSPTIVGAELQIKLMQDPLRADWRNTPIWDNVSLDWDPDVDTTGPSVANIEDNNQGSAVVATNSIVTYAVTFSEPMNASTVDITDFGNASSADATIVSVTPTSDPAVFLVAVMPTSEGTLRLKIAEGAELRDAANNPMIPPALLIQDDVTFEVEAGTPILFPANFVDDRGGSSMAENTLVTYTVSFSKDMKASTVTALDFENVGTAAADIIIGAINETTATSGVFTVLVTPTTSGTLQLRVKQGVLLEAEDGGKLNTLSAIADDTILVVDSDAPTLTEITDDTGGNPVAIGTLVTYEVFFSEDMNASTVNADDFENALTTGNAPFTIDSVEEAFPNVYRIGITPTGTGSIQLQVKVGASFSDKLGNSLNTSVAILDEETINVEENDPYEDWSGGVAFHLDANNDGVQNGLAWMLGAGSASENSSARLPAASESSGNLVLTFTCLKVANRGDTILKVQYSRDLGVTDPWHDAIVPDTAGSAGIVNFTIPSINADPDLVNIQATIPASAATPGTKLFARLISVKP